MKKITFLLSFLGVAFFTSAQILTSNVVPLSDFESNTLGDVVACHSYWSTTDVGTATCVIAVDPLSANNKVLSILPTNYNSTAQFTITIPAGKTLANYDHFYYDFYSTALHGLNSQIYVKVGGTVILQEATGYPSKGVSGVWTPNDIVLNPVTLSTLANESGTILLKIGLTSNNDGQYYLDNLRLHEKTITGIENVQKSLPLIVYLDGDSFKLNQIMDKAELFDLSGRKLLTVVNTSVISASRLKSGVYIIKSSLAGESYVTKIVK